MRLPCRIENLDGKGMNLRLELGLEGPHDRTVLRDPGLAGKLRGRDSDAEVGFSTLPPTSMTFMSVALVDHFKMGGSEFLRKFLLNVVADGHMITNPVWPEDHT